MSRILKDIRAKCLDCCGGYPSEVRECGITRCTLHPYRMGSNPFRKSREFSNEQRAALAERLPNGRCSNTPENKKDSEGGTGE
jgi:hypothetical protein